MPQFLNGSDEQGQSYLGELRANLRPLLAASLGIGGGLNLFAYAASIMAPHLVEEFGWSRSQFALVGLTMFTTLLILPFVGRMTDTLGVRAVASLGAVLAPASIACFSLMDGPFYQYLLISTGVLAVGSLGTPVVYTRLIAANFHRARGLALTIATCAPALLGAIGAPVLSDFVDTHGWRTGYRALALFLLLLGVVSVLLIAPGRRDERMASWEGGELRRNGRAVFASIARNRVFWLIAIAMFLCTLQTPLHSAQLNLMLLDNHISTAMAARMVSVYAIGTVIGRISCGLALDRFATYLVAAASMVLPAIGYAVLASDLDAVAAIAFAMFLVGLAVGAEADLLSYLVARYFRLEIYSTVASLVYSAVFLASATGAVTLSLTLRLTDRFSLFLWLVSLTILCGSLLLLRLRNVVPATQPQSEDGAETENGARGPVAATP